MIQVWFHDGNKIRSPRREGEVARRFAESFELGPRVNTALRAENDFAEPERVAFIWDLTHEARRAR